jgi:hypothetical protein
MLEHEGDGMIARRNEESRNKAHAVSAVLVCTGKRELLQKFVIDAPIIITRLQSSNNFAVT